MINKHTNITDLKELEEQVTLIAAFVHYMVGVKQDLDLYRSEMRDLFDIICIPYRQQIESTVSKGGHLCSDFIVGDRILIKLLSGYPTVYYDIYQFQLQLKTEELTVGYLFNFFSHELKFERLTPG